MVNGSRNEQLPGRLNAQNTRIRLQVQSLTSHGIPPLGAALITRPAFPGEPSWCVLIWPDNDDAGRRVAARIAELIWSGDAPEDIEERIFNAAIRYGGLAPGERL